MSDSKARIDQALKSLSFEFCGSAADFVAEARSKLGIAVDPTYAKQLVDESDWRHSYLRSTGQCARCGSRWYGRKTGPCCGKPTA